MVSVRRDDRLGVHHGRETMRIATADMLNMLSCRCLRSPGKPRISGDAVLDFILELVAVPGKDEEILETNGLTD